MYVIYRAIRVSLGKRSTQYCINPCDVVKCGADIAFCCYEQLQEVLLSGFKRPNFIATKYLEV